MEKMIIFLPMIIFFGFFILLILGFIFLVFKLISKSKADAWEGQVIDRKFVTKEDMDDHKQTYYHVVVRLTDGREKKVGLSRQIYDSYQIGDKIKKTAGRLYPEKVL